MKAWMWKVSLAVVVVACCSWLFFGRNQGTQRGGKSGPAEPQGADAAQRTAIAPTDELAASNRDAGSSAQEGEVGAERAATEERNLGALAPAELVQLKAELRGTSNWDLQRRIISEMAAIHATYDVEGGLAFYRELVAASNNNLIARQATAFANSLVEDLGYLNPELGAGLVLQLEELHQNQAAVLLLQQWALDDPEAAANWTVGLPPGSLQSVAVRAMDTAFREGDHIDLAAAWAEELSVLPNAEWFGGAIGYHLGKADPDAAFNFVVGLSDDFIHKSLPYFVEALAEVDPAQTLKYTDSFPDGYLKDVSQQRAMFMIAQSDPAMAAEMADQRQNADGYSVWVESIYPLWSKDDPEAAGRWLQAANIPAELKAYLGHTAP